VRANAVKMAPMIGNHLALDLLNTQARSHGEAIDYWNSGEDVLAWLERHNAVPPSLARKAIDRPALLASGKALRALAHRLILRFKKGSAVDADRLNTFLHAYRTAPHLERDAAGHLVLTRIAQGEPTASLLGPVAEAVARLLIEGDPTRIKQCEHPDCVLWFYDRTKARKRRWCSMAVCGNRCKAARFRERSGG